LQTLSFEGAGTTYVDSGAWRVDSSPPESRSDGLTCGNDGSAVGRSGTVDNPALYSGCGYNLDRAITRTVHVPASDAVLRFRALWDLEDRWDFGFVQVRDETSGQFESVSCTDTTDEAEVPDLLPTELPGFTGESGGWRDQSCDLSSFADEDVTLAFRNATDSGAAEAGFWVDDVSLGGADISRGVTLQGWRLAHLGVGNSVDGFTLQLIAFQRNGSAAWIARVRPLKGVDGNFHANLTRAQLRTAIGRSRGTVAAIITQDDPDESQTVPELPTLVHYAPYALRVNGSLQGGGGRLDR
jgi:hypothetical protein